MLYAVFNRIENGVFYYDSGPKVTDLKCKCYVCTKDIVPVQRWNFDLNLYNVNMKCCGREETVKLTEEQIKLNNETGVYYAFMGIR